MTRSERLREGPERYHASPYVRFFAISWQDQASNDVDLHGCSFAANVDTERRKSAPFISDASPRWIFEKGFAARTDIWSSAGWYEGAPLNEWKPDPIPWDWLEDAG